MKEELLTNIQKFDKYYLVAPGSDYGRAMWDDISLLDNAVILPQAIVESNKLVEILHHIHFSFAINKRFQLPFQSVWKKKYSLNKVDLDRGRICVIFTDVSAGRTDRAFLKSLSEKESVTLILILVNTMARRKEILRDRLNYFDQKFTFDKNDSENYGFIFHPANYSKLDLTPICVRKDSSLDEKNDAFFVGVSKGRLKLLQSINSFLKKNGKKTAFYVSGVRKNEVTEDGIHYNKWLSYAEVLRNITNTNCIVEVLEEHQSGITLRTMEAICYNKRLLTNNQSIKESPFFKSGYISVFSDENDIDISFINETSTVDYKYNDEFSPIHLIDRINELTD